MLQWLKLNLTQHGVLCTFSRDSLPSVEYYDAHRPKPSFAMGPIFCVSKPCP